MSGLLTKYPNIVLVTRDRSKSYAHSILKAHPLALQVPDRFHLTKDVNEAIAHELRYLMPYTLFWDKKAKKVVDIDVFSQLKPSQQKRLDNFNKVKELIAAGYSVDETATQVGLTSTTVRNYKKTDKLVFHSRKDQRGLSKFHSDIVELLNQGLGHVKIYNYLTTEKGFDGSDTRIKRYISNLRKLGITSGDIIPVHYRDIVKAIFDRKTPYSDEVEGVINSNPEIKKIIKIAHSFNEILYDKKCTEVLKAWIKKYEKGKFKSKKVVDFVRGIKKGYDYIVNCITSEYSNGIAEGIINKVKVLKRAMYGRCSLELLLGRIFLSQNRHV